MSGYRVTHSSAAGRFADGQPGPEGVHQARHVTSKLFESVLLSHFAEGQPGQTRRVSQ